MNRARGGRGGSILLIVLAVVGIGAVGVDAVARSTVERRASTEIASQLPSGGPMEVSIGGWPFLAFLVTDRVDSVRVTGTDVTLTRDGRSVTLASVEVTATGVRNPRVLADAVAARVDLVGVVPWADVSREVGAEVGYAGDGRLEAVETIEILGQSLDAVFSAAPGVTVDTQRFTLSDPRAGLGPLT
ncbi:MAG TPA: DUF2993 domain-containing protein, partial [Propionibacteriaceae bacterium]|nr:DUF2993 domain-containing protein [Propionibacteriaceae bacterium]